MIASAHQSVLILAPHPDDESLGCGGTAKLLTQSGVNVDVLFMTEGENGFEAPEAASEDARANLKAVRHQEAVEACHLLGVRQVFFLPGADGQLGEQTHLVQELVDVLQREHYNRVFCPWFQEAHPDHRATFQILQQALAYCPWPMQVWLYEVWTPLLPNVYVPIDETFEDKVAAIQAHRSQVQWMDYVGAFRGFSAYRGLFCPNSRYAEAFLSMDREAVVGMR